MNNSKLINEKNTNDRFAKLSEKLSQIQVFK